MTAGINELQAFHQFLTDQLAIAKAPLTPEQCLEMWRDQYTSDDELQQSTEAVKKAITDMEAGDTGRAARDVLEEARQRHNLT